jgi:serine/threonine protein kinase
LAAARLGRNHHTRDRKDGDLALTVLTQAPLQPPLATGEELAPGYTVVEHVSRNQALDVYDVWDDGRYCRSVAKTLRPDRLGEERATARLRLEGELLARFTHPHLVRAYETLEEPRTIVVIETLSGETLAAHIEERTKRMPAAEVALLGLQIASAMRYMHREGYLHIDLKPSNIVLDLGVAKVLDLSLARPPGPVRAGVGTRCYLAPEQARGENVTAAADVWGVGVVLWEAAVGEPAFDDEAAGVRYPQCVGRAPEVRHRRRLPAGLAEVIDACLEPDASARPAVDDVLAALEPYA